MRTLFEDVMVSHRDVGRAALMPLSAALHAAAVGAAVLVPILVSDDAPAPLSLVPPIGIRRIAAPPGPGAGPSRRTSLPRPVRTQPARAFVAPLDTPTADPAEAVSEEDGVLGATEDGWPCGDECTGGLGIRPGGGGEGPVDVAEPEAPTRPLRAVVEIREPTKLRHVAPVYPELARVAGIGGVVILECTLSPEGRVSDIRILRSHPLLEAAAVNAVRQWIYSPSLVNGRPVSVILNVTVRFISRR